MDPVFIAVPSILLGSLVLCCCICVYKSCEIDRTDYGDPPTPRPTNSTNSSDPPTPRPVVEIS